MVGADRPAAVCRELTKLHEEIARGTLAELAERFAEGARGEVTLVIEGRPDDAAPEPVDREAAIEQARALLDEGLRTKAAARRLAEALGLTAGDAYAIVLEARGS